MIGEYLDKKGACCCRYVLSRQRYGARDLIGQSFRNQRFGPGRTPTSTATSTDKEHKVYGIVSPHAGYIYSGVVAANGFYKISPVDFQDVIMVGPNHYGIGSWVAAMKDGTWETPLGDVEVNSQMAEEIGGRSSYFLILTIMPTAETIAWRFSCPSCNTSSGISKLCQSYSSLRSEI